MKIALIQQHATKDKNANVARGLAALETAARNGAQLACFAELAFEWFYPQRPADRGFRDLAEPLDGPTVKAFQQKAKELGIVTVINLYERTASTPTTAPRDRCRRHAARRDANDSHHRIPVLPRAGLLHPGDKGAPVYSTKAGKIGVSICYDRHFPEYMRALVVAGADLVIVPRRRRRRMAKGSRSGDARRRVPERLLHRALQSRRQGDC